MWSWLSSNIWPYSVPVLGILPHPECSTVIKHFELEEFPERTRRFINTILIEPIHLSSALNKLKTNVLSLKNGWSCISLLHAVASTELKHEVGYASLRKRNACLSDSGEKSKLSSVVQPQISKSWPHRQAPMTCLLVLSALSCQFIELPWFNPSNLEFCSLSKIKTHKLQFQHKSQSLFHY